NDDDVSNDDGNEDNSNDDGGDNDSDDERTESAKDENPNLNQNDDDIEEEYDDEYARTPSSYKSTNDENKHVNEEEYDLIDEELYKDVNMKLKDVEHGEERKGDAEKTDASYDNVTQETTYEDDAHVTLKYAHFTQKTEGPLQSSSVSSDFTTQFLILDNVPQADNEILSMINVKVRHEEHMSDFVTPVIKSTITESLEDVVLAQSSSQPQSTYDAAASLERAVKTEDKDEDSHAEQTKDEKKEEQARMSYKVVPSYYFINNELEVSGGRSSSKKYTTSTTKIKAAKYDIPGIEDMVPSLWSSVKVSYDRYAVWGISHWVPKRQRFYGFASNKEGDFPRLHIYDIQDILLLLVQKKLSNLERDVIFNLGPLWMFTRRIVILKRVEDLQLGVESYQNKLNITKPETFRLMRIDELYKFGDGTLTFVRSVLDDITSNLRLDYLPKRRWSS
ncbi:hypothetical protein Tco_0039103, partial [Tanacetum coccineum]